MTLYDQKQSACIKNYLVEVENQNKGYQMEKETLFKELSVQIHSLISQFSHLAVIIDQKNAEFQTFKKESGKWTKSTQKSKEDCLKDSEIIIQQQSNLGYSDQTFKQKVESLIQRELHLKQKILLFIEKDLQLKQKISQFIQKKNELKQRDELIHELQKTLENQKQKYRLQLQTDINQITKVQKTRLQSQFNKKIIQIKEQYELKSQQNIRKTQRVISILKQEKQKSITLLHQEIINLQKKYQEKIKQNNFKSPEKTRKIMQEYGGKLKAQTDQKLKSENQGKLKNANTKITDLQGIIKKLQFENDNINKEKSKLITKIQALQINSIQKTNRISQKENQATKKQEQLKRMAEQLKLKNEECQKLQRTVKSLQAKIANLTQELRRSKKSSEEIREMTNKNVRHLQKLLDDSKKDLLQSKKAYFTLNSLFESVKNQIKQKEIRIQSMERQLERTKNYNQILVKQNASLNEIIENLGQKTNQLQISTKFSLDDLKVQHEMKSSKSSHKVSINHTKSLGNIYKHQCQSQTQLSQEEKSKMNTSIFNRMSIQSFCEKNQQNLLGRDLILPLSQVEKNHREAPNSLRENIEFNYSSFQTTFSPLISPGYSIGQRTEAANSQTNPNILNWNPQSPINEIQSLYNSLNSRNRPNHELRSQELIEKMSSLSREKNKKQRSSNSHGITDIVLQEPLTNENHRKIEQPLKIPKLKPLSRHAFKNSQQNKRLSSPQEDRVLNLSFESNNLYDRSSFFNKKTVPPNSRLDTLKSSLKASK